MYHRRRIGGTLLSVYTRHLPDCPQTDINYRRCRCPKWIQGVVKGHPRIRESAKTTSWEQAEKIARNREEAIIEPTRQRKSIEDAVASFIKSKEGARVSENWLAKLRRLTDGLKAFAKEKGFTYLDQLTSVELIGWRATWKFGPTTTKKTQERLRIFFNFCIEQEWLKKNPATNKAMGRVIVKEKPTLPYTREEYERILATTYDENYWTKNPYQRTRLRALVELMRWSGLRITDAVTCARERLTPETGEIFLYQQKTGEAVYVQIPPHVVELLRYLKNDNAAYFFWSGTSKRLRACNSWERSLKSLFERSKIANGHSHRLRDTFAVELLLEDVPIDQVSILLGHSSVKTTEESYAAFVRARQVQLAKAAQRAWPTPKLELVKQASAGAHC